MSLTLPAVILPGALPSRTEFESDELRRNSKKCRGPIQFEGKIKGAGFVQKGTENHLEEAKC